MSMSVALPLIGDGHYQMQWDYILTSFPPDSLYVFGDEAKAPGTNVFSRLEAVYIADASDLPDQTTVVLAQDNGRAVQGDQDLTTFIHPQDAIYLFGNDVEWLNDAVLGGRVPDHKVYIPTDTHDDLFSWQAYAITVWDRRMKLG